MMRKPEMGMKDSDSTTQLGGDCNSFQTPIASTAVDDLSLRRAKEIPMTMTTQHVDGRPYHCHHQGSNSRPKNPIVTYKECLKNHAASIGGHAVDGCGEFIPATRGSSSNIISASTTGKGGGGGGEEEEEEGEDHQILDALKCSACGCHRNFHRKEVEVDIDHQYPHHSTNSHYYYNQYSPSNINGHRAKKQGIMMWSPKSHPHGPHPHHQVVDPTSPSGSDIGTDGYPYGCGCGGLIATGNEEIIKGASAGTGTGTGSNKKRFRTKFTHEQKEKMLSFAEKAGWKMQKLNEAEVQHFCQEAGIKRRVLKVWMHNNKHNYANAKKIVQSP